MSKTKRKEPPVGKEESPLKTVKKEKTPPVPREARWDNDNFDSKPAPGAFGHEMDSDA